MKFVNYKIIPLFKVHISNILILFRGSLQIKRILNLSAHLLNASNFVRNALFGFTLEYLLAIRPLEHKLCHIPHFKHISKPTVQLLTRQCSNLICIVAIFMDKTKCTVVECSVALRVLWTEKRREIKFPILEVI